MNTAPRDAKRILHVAVRQCKMYFVTRRHVIRCHLRRPVHRGVVVASPRENVLHAQPISCLLGHPVILPPHFTVSFFSRVKIYPPQNKTKQLHLTAHIFETS